ncbi:amine sulfotransferase [Rhizobiales bacterium GAS188]|nr:amine sulfotransferase [Rhizobiales bacterium GAS188]
MQSKSINIGWRRFAANSLTWLAKSMQLLSLFFQITCILVKSASFRLRFQPRVDDIFIVSYPRSGTTWLQMILYQLTTAGSMDFAHISEVVPFFERQVFSNQDFERMQSPRVFKTHLIWRQSLWATLTQRRVFHALWRFCVGNLNHTSGKYIYIIRDGKDVLNSYWNFHVSHLNYKRSFDRFFQEFMAGKVQYASWFAHVKAARVRAATHDNVLILQFEDLHADFSGSIRTIANFCGIELSPETYQRTLDRANLHFMKESEDKFDHITAFCLEKGLTRGKFINAGRIGAGAQIMNVEQQGEFDRMQAIVFGS